MTRQRAFAVLMFAGLLAYMLASGCSTTKRITRVGNATAAAKPAGCLIEAHLRGSPPSTKFEVVANIEQGDSGFSVGCDHKAQIRKLKDAACELGADAVVDVAAIETDIVNTSTCTLLTGTAVIWTASN